MRSRCGRFSSRSSLLLVVVCVNVAILVYARTATRQGEIAVRGALGASRRRIVGQLFVEALLLSGVSAALGIALLAFSLRQINASILAMAGRLPFWMSLDLTADGVIYIVALAMLAAGHRRRGAGAQGHGTPGAHRAARAVAGQRLAHADGTAVDAVDRHAGGPDRGAVADGDVPGVESAAVPHRRCRLCEPGVPDRSHRARSRVDRRILRRRRARVPRAGMALRMPSSNAGSGAEPAVNGVTFSMVSPGEELAVVVEVEGQPVAARPGWLQHRRRDRSRDNSSGSTASRPISSRCSRCRC